MDFKSLFLSANGRIGRKDFWIGFAILFVANLVLNFIPVIGGLISLALIYCWVCVSSKRFHDMDKSGWLTVVPMGVWVVSFIVAAVVGGAAFFAAAAQGAESAGGMAALGALGAAGLILMLAALFNLGFLLWQGLAAGSPSANRYGPAPGAEAVPAVFS